MLAKISEEIAVQRKTNLKNRHNCQYFQLVQV